jgi:hyperosmotically inducible protein
MEEAIRGDNQLKKNIENRLHWNNLVNEKKLTIEVSDHDVILNGTVSTHKEKKAVEEDVRSIPGIRAVKNLLKVQLTDADLPEDQKIKKRIEKILATTKQIDEDKIEVAVHGGLATLEGSVDALWKRTFIQELAGNLKGTFEIENKITVVPTYKLRDEVIAAEIVKTIGQSDSLDVESIHVKVNNGIVTLSGTLDNQWDRNAVNMIALYTAGVRDIKNKIIARK